MWNIATFQLQSTDVANEYLVMIILTFDSVKEGRQDGGQGHQWPTQLPIIRTKESLCTKVSNQKLTLG